MISEEFILCRAGAFNAIARILERTDQHSALSVHHCEHLTVPRHGASFWCEHVGGIEQSAAGAGSRLLLGGKDRAIRRKDCAPVGAFIDVRRAAVSSRSALGPFGH